MELSDKLRLVRNILHSELGANAKVVGCIIALAIMEDKGYARLSVPTLVERSGLGRRSVMYALDSIHESGMMKRKRTGRAAMWYPGVALMSSEDSGSAPGCTSDVHKVAYHDDPYSTDSPGERADKRNR